MPEGKPMRRVELRLRERFPHGLQDRVRTILKRLRDLERSGKLDAVNLHVWGRWACVSDEDELNARWTDPWSKYVELRDWARKRTVDLEPAFGRREHRSPVQDDCEEVVTFPVICLVVYRDGDIEMVAPCSSEGDFLSVDDCLAELKGESSGHPEELLA